MSRKDVFVSGVSRDLGTYREAAKQALLDIGAHPVEQRNFPTGHGQLGAALADTLDRCDALLHIVGFHYGEEPPPVPDRPRRSYTQLEYYLAVEGPRPKPTYVFLARPDCQFDTADVENSEKQRLQNEHREHLKTTGEIYYEFSTREELRDRIHRSDALRLLIAPRLARIHLLPLGERFTGRRAMLEMLERDLTTGSRVLTQPVVVRGSGGVGKTALAVELGWRLYDAGRFRFVLFLNASTPGTLEGDLAALCGEPALDLSERAEHVLSIRRDAVLGWLADPENGEQTLLILDSADAPDARETVRRLVPKVPHCTVLVTSRHTEWGTMRVRELDLFTAEEAREYLRSRLDAGSLAGGDAALDGIADAVDHLPVALELVSSYLRETHQSPAEWLDEWRGAPAPTLEHHDADAVGYPVALARVWDQSVARLSPLAFGFLGAFASLAPKPASLPLEHIRKQRTWRETRAALAELAKASLITWPRGLDAASVHRVLQAILLHGMSPHERRESADLALTTLSKIQPAPEYDEANWHIWAQLEPHLRTLIGHLREFPFELDARAVFGRYAAWLLYGARPGDDAELLYRWTAAIAERRCGPDDPELASELTGLASALLARNKLAEAEAAARRALAIFETAPGTHESECFCLNTLALILAATDRVTEALTFSRRAISASEKLLGPEHPHTVACLQNLGSWLIALGQRAEAKPILQRVLAAWEARVGPNHPHVAACLNELAELARGDHRYEEAEPLYRRAITIAEAAYGGEHPSIASFLNNLALTLGAAGEADQAAEAERLFSRALAIDVNAFGQDHPKVANRLSNLAWLLRRSGRAGEAEPLARRAVEILMRFKARTARDHTSWASTWSEYVALLVELGEDKEAIQRRYNAIVQKVNEETLRARQSGQTS